MVGGATAAAATANVDKNCSGSNAELPQLWLDSKVRKGAQAQMLAGRALRHREQAARGAPRHTRLERSTASTAAKAYRFFARQTTSSACSTIRRCTTEYFRRHGRGASVG